MNVRVLQHEPFEGLGSIEPWLNERGASIAFTRPYAGDPIPKAEGIDLLIAMGGSMSVNDEDDLPWLKAEKQLVRDLKRADVPMLGVCLGAQLLASALGARVYRNPVKEIGWFPIQSVDAPSWAVPLPPESIVFHWHGETFDLPAGAIHLARSEGCENQAFQIGRRVIGLQFHLEMTESAMKELAENCEAELRPARYVQSANELAAVPRSRYHEMNRLMSRVLAYLVEGDCARRA
jgi:GMP synthase-like glutamine amidotransferase